MRCDKGCRCRHHETLGDFEGGEAGGCIDFVIKDDGRCWKSLTLEGLYL